MGAIWLTSLADWCREAVGPANVIEEPGWQTRSRGSGGYTAGPTHIGIHHTAGKTSPENDKRYMWHNADAKPIGAVLLDRDGRVHVGCAGATNTQGKGKALTNSKGQKVPENKQNEYVLSIEAANAGTGEPWPQAQQDAYVKLCAVFCVKLGLTAGDCLAHFETAPGRKADPAGPSKWEDGTGLSAGNTRVWNMNKFRSDVAVRIQQITQPAPEPQPDPELGPKLNMQIVTPPTRIHDTRLGDAKPAAGKAVTIKHPMLKGHKAAHVTLTAINPGEHGHAILYASGIAPLASNINYQPGATVANTTITELASDGSFQLFTHSGAVDYCIDLVAVG